MSISSVKTGAIGDSLLAGNAAYNPSSFESIATVTLGSSGAVTFSSIPSTYKALQLRFMAKAIRDSSLRSRSIESISW